MTGTRNTQATDDYADRAWQQLHTALAPTPGASIIFKLKSIVNFRDKAKHETQKEAPTLEEND